jgi:hypothetical protein
MATEKLWWQYLIVSDEEVDWNTAEPAFGETYSGTRRDEDAEPVFDL